MDPRFNFDDEPTVIQVQPEELSSVELAPEETVHAPPALPFPLARARREEDWLSDLPQAARQVLEAAARPAPSWPRVPRVHGAVAEPLSLIPSLAPRRHA